MEQQIPVHSLQDLINTHLNRYNYLFFCSGLSDFPAAGFDSACFFGFFSFFLPLLPMALTSNNNSLQLAL